MRQETLTVVAKVQDPQLARAALAGLAAARNRPGPGSMPAVFADPALGIHFARMVLVEGNPSRHFDAQIVFESNFDTEAQDDAMARRSHLALLGSRQNAALTSVFRCCEAFPGAKDVAAYLEARLVPATASYQGHTHRPLGRIRLEQRLRDTIMDFLSREPRAAPEELYHRIRVHVIEREAADPALAGLQADGPAPSLPDPEIRSNALAHQVIPWVLNVHPILPLVPRLPEIAVWDATDRVFDQRARQEGWTAADLRRFTEMAASEDHGAQNALTHLVPLRGGWDRETVLKHAHAYIDRLARNFFDDVGQLGGIPTIHFAKWLLLDEGRRLIFFSNYDGSWESYLGDFVDKAAIGLNLAWSCTEEYPRTHLLLAGGASDEEPFKAWGREHQVPTQVFYSAYPDLSIAAINNNTWIRHGIHPPGPKDLATWFRRLS